MVLSNPQAQMPSAGPKASSEEAAVVAPPERPLRDHLVRGHHHPQATTATNSESRSPNPTCDPWALKLSQEVSVGPR